MVFFPKILVGVVLRTFITNAQIENNTTLVIGMMSIEGNFSGTTQSTSTLLFAITFNIVYNNYNFLFSLSEFVYFNIEGGNIEIIIWILGFSVWI